MKLSFILLWLYSVIRFISMWIWTNRYEPIVQIPVLFLYIYGVVIFVFSHHTVSVDRLGIVSDLYRSWMRATKGKGNRARGKMTMATGGIHHHHAVQAFDLDVLEAISTMPTRNGTSSLAEGFDPTLRKRKTDTVLTLPSPIQVSSLISVFMLPVVSGLMIFGGYMACSKETHTRVKETAASLGTTFHACFHGDIPATGQTRLPQDDPLEQDQEGH